MAELSQDQRHFVGRAGARFAPKVRAKNIKGTLAKLWRYYMTEKWSLLVVFLLVLLDGGILLSVPYLTGKAVDALSSLT